MGVGGPLALFDCRLLAPDPWQEGRHRGARFVNLPALLAEADARSLQALSMSDARGVVGREALTRMRPHAVPPEATS
mgnify:FL=1